jgi:hypothetical protein
VPLFDRTAWDLLYWQYASGDKATAGRDEVGTQLRAVKKI